MNRTYKIGHLTRMGVGYDVMLKLSYTGETLLVFNSQDHYMIFPIIEVPRGLAEFIESEVPGESNG